MKKSNTNMKKSPSSKDTKLPKIGKTNQKNKSPASKSKNMTNTKSNNNLKVMKISANTNNMNQVALKTDVNEKRKKRFIQEKKEEARDKKVYEQVLKEFQEKSKVRTNTEVNVTKRLTSPKNKNVDINNIQLPKIKISEKKTQAILEEGGMLDAYKYLVVQLCKNGLPTGNLFEYSAYVIRNYEKKWKEKKSKANKEKLEQYWKEKKEEVEKFQLQKKKQAEKKAFADKKSVGKKSVNKKQDRQDSKKPKKILTKEEQQKIKALNQSLKEEENKINALNRSLQQREIYKLIQSMDKSRSSLHHQEFPNKSKNKSEEKLPIVKVPQKEGKGNKKGNKGNKIQASANKSAKSVSPQKSNLKKKK